ncbi:MAG TPA: ABC transporter permease [Methylomirabilota bacterium]|nr:ABC transporter permease [Methylomirabilota bacterium]
MRVTEVVRSALRALARHKLRSALTVLGISIGVGAFICSVAVGQGAARQIQEQIRSLGENMIWIEAGGRNVNGVRTGTHGTRSLTQGDARAIQEQVALVDNVSPNVDTHSTVVYHNQNWYTQVRGVTPNYLPVRHWQIERGGPFSQEDVDYAAKVCLLGQTVVANLFGSEDPVGETIRVQTLPCRVVGVLAPKGQSPTGQDQDDVVIMPFTTVQKKMMGIYWLDDIFCSAASPAAIGAAEAEITALLRERHHVLADQADDFNLRHPVEIAKASAAAQRTMTLLLGCIASVALLVGGIGVMNIMLVSVAERTREIGIRMAVGARGHDILAQFLVEAVTLSLIGGGIGVVLGLLGAYGIASIARWQTLIRADAIAAALTSSGAVGIFFGFYPARRASRLEPIEALRR